MDRIKQLTEDIYDCLPATTWNEVLGRLQGRPGRAESTYAEMAEAVRELRKAPTTFGWTIPHIKRGMPAYVDGNRIFAVFTKNDGSYDLDHDPTLLEHIRRGQQSDVKTWATQSKNMVAILEAVSKHTRKRWLKYQLAEVSDEFLHISRKAVRLLAIIDDDLADGTGGP